MATANLYMNWGGRKPDWSGLRAAGRRGRAERSVSDSEEVAGMWSDGAGAGRDGG